MTTGALCVERATRADLSAILSVQHLAFAPEAQQYPEANARGELAPLTQTLPELEVESDQRLILTGRLNGELIASVRGHVDMDGVAHIGRLAVHPAWQGRGYGTALMQAIETALGARTFSLFTDGNNAGNLRLYARLGYTPTGEHLSSPIPLVQLQKRTFRD